MTWTRGSQAVVSAVLTGLWPQAAMAQTELAPAEAAPVTPPAEGPPAAPPAASTPVTPPATTPPPEDADRFPAPSAAWLVGGGAAIAAGLGLYGWGVHRAAGGDDDCFLQLSGSTCGLMLTLGPELTLGGGALLAAWSWKRGAHLAALDRQQGHLQDQSGLRHAGLALGITALVLNAGAQVYIFAKAISCGLDSLEATDEVDRSCFETALRHGFYAYLAATPLLVAAALMVGYGYGYDQTAELLGGRVALAPLLGPRFAGVGASVSF